MREQRVDNSHISTDVALFLAFNNYFKSIQTEIGDKAVMAKHHQGHIKTTDGKDRGTDQVRQGK